jgi:hypothetical protein
MRICEDARGKATLLGSLVAGDFSIETLANDPNLCEAVARQIRSSATAVRLATVEQDRRRLLNLFKGTDRTSVLARQLLGEVVGKSAITSDKVSVVWSGLLNRLTQLKGLARDFGIIKDVTHAIAAAGAPEWAKVLSTGKATPDDPRTSSGWREAWDHAAAETHLARIDARQRFMRHYYDLYSLLQRPEVQAFIGTDDYKAHKKKRFRRGDNPDITQNQAFILTDPATHEIYAKAYDESAALYFGDKPAFEEILKEIGKWIERL